MVPVFKLYMPVRAAQSLVSLMGNSDDYGLLYREFKPPSDNGLAFLGLKGGCRGSSESIDVKMPHCWKSHVTAH